MRVALALLLLAGAQDEEVVSDDGAAPDLSGKLAAMPEGVAPETQAVALRFGSLAADFTDAFAASFAIIVCSEIGDKTFFIAAILSMRQNPYVVFAGAIAALALMTCLSVAIGWLVPTLMSKVVAHYAFVLLFLVFGVRLLYDASQMEGGVSEELQEVEAELKKKDEDPSDEMAEEDGSGRKECCQPQKGSRKSGAVFTQSFVMTFVAEWGDRSQISTIALGAAKNWVGVTLGAVIGHALCSAAACIGGKLLASKISEKTVAFSGGILFLIFAATALYGGVEQ
jgi:putative Ca2+/H+ antiporter (TMEM165/GDT1 family)